MSKTITMPLKEYQELSKRAQRSWDNSLENIRLSQIVGRFKKMRSQFQRWVLEDVRKKFPDAPYNLVSAEMNSLTEFGMGKFGDTDYDWSRAGAVTIADEITHNWD